jgi:hypothetical protein
MRSYARAQVGPSNGLGAVVKIVIKMVTVALKTAMTMIPLFIPVLVICLEMGKTAIVTG